MRSYIWPLMRVLVTGGAGFIGSHTVDHLLARGHQVRILDSLQSRVHPLGRPDYVPENADFILGDVSDRDTLRSALQDCDSVIHLAAYQDYLPEFSTFIHTNTESAALLLELVVNDGLPIRKIVFASSQSVAGEGLYYCDEHGEVIPGPRPFEQLEAGDWEVRCPHCGSPMQSRPIPETVSHPHTAYGISKLAIELLARNLGMRYGISTACMRYTYVQGARNSFFNAYSGICRLFALRISLGSEPICYEDAQQLRDYVNVADVARANVIALENPSADNIVLNVGGGRAVTVLDFARMMLQAMDSDLQPSVPGTFRVGDTRHTVSDTSAMQSLGWKPTVSVEQSIREYLEWFGRFRGTRDYLLEAERIMRKQGVIRNVKRRN